MKDNQDNSGNGGSGGSPGTPPPVTNPTKDIKPLLLGIGVVLLALLAYWLLKH